MAASERLSITVDGRTVALSSPDKVLFDNPVVTKADLGRYYAAVGPTMLPHVRGRAITLVRHPKGIDADGFFQKNTPAHYPDWIPRLELRKSGGLINHSVVDHPAALVYFAQQNMITPHIGLTRIDDLEHPDLFVVDLDPSTTDFGQLRRVALEIKAALEQAGLVPFVQLTGSKGVHVVAPLVPHSASWQDVHQFGRALSTMLLERLGDDLTMEFSKAERGDRIYLDLGRNNYQATFAAPYGVRAFQGAPVATPITWPELLQPAMGPRAFSIHTILDRLATVGDPWATMADAAAVLPA